MEERKVFEAVKKLNKDKAPGPGPNGFSMAFSSCLVGKLSKKCYEGLDFHMCGKFVKHLNAIFISLIPKKGGFVEVTDFRPTSLVRGIYKITKVLANRLKTVLEKMISKTQKMLSSKVIF